MTKEEELFSGMELRPEMGAIHSINPFFDTDTSSRLSMFGNHFSQCLTLLEGEEKRIQTGLESIMSRHTHSVRVPVDCTVVKLIPRYRSGVGAGSVPDNGEYYLIYEEVETLRLGVLVIKTFGSFHTYFGFPYKYTEEFMGLTPGTFLEKGTDLAVPVSVKKNQGYSFGLNLNTVYMSIPEVAEDGFVISESAIKRLKVSLYEKRKVEVGANAMPLNLYGDDKNYKSFPEVGDHVHPSGVVMATREDIKEYFPVLMHPKMLRDFDPLFDNLTYARGPDGVVVDVKVHHNLNRRDTLYDEMSKQFDKYSAANMVFYKEILETIEKHANTRSRYPLSEPGLLTNDLQRLVIEAMAHTSSKTWKLSKLVTKTFSGDVTDEFIVELVIRYDLVPHIGWKLTDMHGGKGVIAKIVPDHMMPVDADGNVADIIVDPASVIGRINPGRQYEQYINGSIVKAERIIRGEVQSYGYEKAWISLLEYLRLVSPQQFESYSNIDNPDDIKEIIDEIVKNQLMIYYPVDGKRSHLRIVNDNLRNSRFAPPVGKVKIGLSGREEMSEEDIIVAPQYFMLLEKIADSWQASASTRVNHFRVPATTNKGNKHKLPWRASVPRFLGESEVRIISSFCDPEAISELLDRATNVKTHLHVYEQILTADKPTAIDTLVNRRAMPYGNGIINKMVRQMANVSGFDFVYTEEDKS